MNLSKTLATFALAAMTMGSAHAGLIGHQVMCISTSGSLPCDPSMVAITVGAGVEAYLDEPTTYGRFLSLDFDDTGLTVTNVLGGGIYPFGLPGGYSVLMADTTVNFPSAVLASSTIAGFDASDVSLVGGLLTLRLDDVSVPAGGSFRIDIGRRVPEPGALALLAATAIGAGVAMRRRRD